MVAELERPFQEALTVKPPLKQALKYSFMERSCKDYLSDIYHA